jgi:hypothetical protein
MRCPSKKTLLATFRDLTPENADKIRKLAALAGDRDALEVYIQDHCPETHAYARQCHHDPFTSQMWRNTMALHAIDVALGGCGIEALGPDVGGPKAPPYEYVNFGDPYTTTLIFTLATDTLRIGCWGDIAEKHNWP